jgi:hypothetical protein
MLPCVADIRIQGDDTKQSGPKGGEGVGEGVGGGWGAVPGSGWENPL